jgi:hypothetical protein
MMSAPLALTSQASTVHRSRRSTHTTLPQGGDTADPRRKCYRGDKKYWIIYQQDYKNSTADRVYLVTSTRLSGSGSRVWDDRKRERERQLLGMVSGSSTFSTIKDELFGECVPSDVHEVELALFLYIEEFYNSKAAFVDLERLYDA